MRQPSTVQLGEFGEDSASAFFTGVGWGPLKTHKHDLGTDLFVQLRTDELVDLRMLLGVQVKTGPSFFDEPATISGREGWWYREGDKKHAEYWTNHHVPHILVLQSQDMLTRVWTVLDRTTIQDTGVGMKVFVPADQLLDVASKSRWVELVTEARKLLSFEGSRWTFSITQVPEEAWVRYALLVPRLVVPHPNRGYGSDINWAEAIATCSDGEPHQWERFASQRPDVPSPAEALVGNDPGWRLAGAISQWVMGESGPLTDIRDADFPPYLAVARIICAATAAVDKYELDHAALLLTAARAEGELSADQVWLGVHLAHVRRLQGRLDEAEALLQDALAGSAALSVDITTSALRSACILGLFDLAPFDTGDVGAAVTASDNSTSWWRTHSVAAGLQSDVKKRFRKWARDRSIALGGTASAHNDLFSAAFTARLAGDFMAWRGYTAMLAQTDLITPTDGADVASSIESLRRIGDQKTLKLAVRKVRADGPLESLAEVAEDARPENATSLSIVADLELLAECGAHFSTDQARRWIDVLLRGLTDPDSFYERYAIRHWAFHEMITALTGLQRHLSSVDQVAVIEFARALPDDTSEVLRSHLANLLRQFDTSILDRELADTDLAAIGWPAKLFRDLLAPRSAPFRSEVRRSLLAGDLAALSGANDVTAIEGDEAVVLLDACDAAFAKYSAPANGIAMGGQDYYRLATVLALNGPEATRERAWSAVVSALGATVDVHERKHASIRLLAEHAAEIPSDYVSGLTSTARKLRMEPPSKYADRRFGLDAIAPVATELLLELDRRAPDTGDLIAALLAGDSRSRLGACNAMARRSGYEATLLAVTHDADAEVAARATRGLARRVAADRSLSPVYLAELIRLGERGGESFPLAILAGLAHAIESNDRVRALLEMLVDHPSPALRDGTAQLMTEREWSAPSSRVQG